MPNWCGGGRVRGSRDKPSETNSPQLDRVRGEERRGERTEERWRGETNECQKKPFSSSSNPTEL